MIGHEHGPTAGLPVLAGLLLVAGVLYLIGVARLYSRGRRWPHRRTLLWLAGTAIALLAVTGPIAERAHTDLRAHMIGHVLLGMLAPLLLVLAAPGTLALAALPVRRARRLSALLRSRIVGVLTFPAVAAVLDIGGLWVLYRSDLYAVSIADSRWHLLVQLHLLLAGYLFAFVLVGPDPTVHRTGLGTRCTVLVLSIAAHNVLAKTIYAIPPRGVPPEQAGAAAQLMYYAAAPVEIALLVLLGLQWYAGQRRERSATISASLVPGLQVR